MTSNGSAQRGGGPPQGLTAAAHLGLKESMNTSTRTNGTAQVTAVELGPADTSAMTDDEQALYTRILEYFAEDDARWSNGARTIAADLGVAVNDILRIYVLTQPPEHVREQLDTDLPYGGLREVDGELVLYF